MIKFLLIPFVAFLTLLTTSNRGACSDTGRQMSTSLHNPIDAEAEQDAERVFSTDFAPSKINPMPLLPDKIAGEIILKRSGYICSYNPKTLQPNYVAWTLTPGKLEGQVKRDPQFYEDMQLDASQRALLEDYYNSGLTRGHMCPAADNKWSDTAMGDCFLLSNICPQTQTNNAGDWEHLESACRTWVRNQKITIHIVCGPIFDEQPPQKIHRRIPVPTRFFKAIICVDKGKEKGVAFIQNNNTDQKKLTQYACTIDDVEKLTGYDLFHELDNKLEKQIEAQDRVNVWYGERR